MTSYFPKQIAYRAILVYLVALLIVSTYYYDYAMKVGYIVLGIVWVLGFFLIVSFCSRSWKNISSTQFLEYLIPIALILRLLWVVSSYYYYIDATGIPFEIGVADALGYHEGALWLSEYTWGDIIDHYINEMSYGISDVGYPIYLTVLYKLFGPSILLARIIKAVLSTLTCVLIYRLSSRVFGESIGRIAGIMCALMPNLVIYCGYHLKETEMIFLEVAFLERFDYLIRNRKFSVFAILLPTILAFSLFFFRTVLGAAAIFSAVTGILLSSTPTMGGNMKRVALIGWGVVCLLVFSGGTAMTEVEALWEERDTSVENKRVEQTSRGNQWAQYATGTVMAPLSFVLPFSTMIEVDQQYNQNTKHGGNYIRNFMGFFALLAIYEAIRRKRWREFAMVGSFVVAYLGVISLSGFSNSERFLLPALPVLIMMWAYGISTLRKETYRLLPPWCIIVIAMEVGWAYFKLGSRGLF